MKEKSILLIAMLVAVIFPTSATAVTLPTSATAVTLPASIPAATVVTPSPPNPPAPSNPIGSNSMMGPAAQNTLAHALELKEKAHSLLDQATEQGLDTEEIRELIEKADKLLEMAEKTRLINPIPAMNMMREAVEIYEQAISELEALLG